MEEDRRQVSWDDYHWLEDRRNVSWDDYHWLEERCEDLQESNFKLACQIKDIADYIKNNDIAGAMEYLVSEGLC